MPAAMPITGAATVILAMGAGKTAAASIDKYIQSKNAIIPDKPVVIRFQT